MTLRCMVVRGLVKEVEEDINKFLETHEARIVNMAQSGAGEYVSVTLIYEQPDDRG